MFCSTCGAENSNEARFCARCGTAMQAGGSAAPAGAPAAAAAPLGAPGPAHSSGKAIASLICGLFGFIPFSAIAAVILGHLALSNIRKSGGRVKGEGLAIAGLVFGYLGVLLIPLLIAAIAIPNLLRARITANEISAAASLRTINSAALTYSARYSNGYPANLSVLDGEASGESSCDHAQLINSEFASGKRTGYIFTYTLEAADGSSSILSAEAARNGCTIPGGSAFTVTANPVSSSTGLRSFFTDQTGVIRASVDGPATADSPPLE